MKTLFISLLIIVITQPFQKKIHAEFDNCPAQYELKDSIKLTHIKNEFYKNNTGHLYEKTVGLREVKNKLVDVTYFNGVLLQEVDPFTFKKLDGWYAKDKNNAYSYRPVSGGMQISKIKNADPKTFKIVNGHYQYAMDKNHFYDGLQVIEGFEPNKTKLKLDKKQRAISMKSNSKVYTFELEN